ncbi:hypothetical protein ElyMa_003020600 [Elysia marginata]|uniref:Uncharacterized protein n=1 Tax=Elysia marginata TaxID=1093978 RepID=A0AAV4IFR6_9GAST|nr:hypothetical protein ElyMa_003020600 [Elysia marginata]
MEQSLRCLFSLIARKFRSNTIGFPRWVDPPQPTTRGLRASSEVPTGAASNTSRGKCSNSIRLMSISSHENTNVITNTGDKLGQKTTIE